MNKTEQETPFSEKTINGTYFPSTLYIAKILYQSGNWFGNFWVGTKILHRHTHTDAHTPIHTDTHTLSHTLHTPMSIL